MQHIIWDWNGTLLNDLPIIIDAVNDTVDEVGLRRITLDDYRSYYTRPVKKFYDSIAGEEIEHDLWKKIDHLFHVRYEELLGQAALAAGAHDVLTNLDQGPNSQSLLSMAPNAGLQDALHQFGVRRYFEIAQGNTGPPGGFKDEHLAEHLRRVGLDPGAVTMIGDTVDDAHAAMANDIDIVLYDDGSHHRHDLEALGVPVAESLADAVEVALG